MCVLQYGKEIVRQIAQRGIDVGAHRALIHPPAVIAALHDRRVDFLACALADVAHPELAGPAIEAEAPGIAHAERKNFVAPGRVDEGIVERRGIERARNRVRMIDVDTQYLAQQHIGVLCVVRRIVARAAVTRPQVQVAVGSEGQHAAVVVGLTGMRDDQEHALARPVRHIRIGGDRVLGEDQRTIARARVIDVEAAVHRILRMKGEP